MLYAFTIFSHACQLRHNPAFDILPVLVILRINLKENMPQRYRDAEVEIIRVPKNNDRMFEGISVRPQDKGSGAVFYCVDAYLDYLHNESLEKTISLYLMRLVHYLDHMPGIDAEDIHTVPVHMFR